MCRIKRRPLIQKCNKGIQKIINLYEVAGENIKEHNPNWPQIPDHTYRIFTYGGFGSGKTN